MLIQIVGLAICFGLCVNCAPCLAADNLPYSPSAAPNQHSALCPPGQAAARPTGQLWVNQAELHTAWDCFVPRPHAFAGRSGQGPDPAQHSALPSFAGTRDPSSPAARPAAGPAPSQPVQVKLEVEVGVDLQVSANGEPVAASSGQVNLPPVNLNLSGSSVQTSATPSTHNAALDPGFAATPVQGAQSGPITPVPETSIAPVLPVQPPNPDPAAPDAIDPNIISPAAIAPQANPAEPDPEVDALLNARPILPNQGAGSERGLVSPKV